MAAGAWLRQHNSGGTIVSTPMNHGITERSVLALGDYTGLMYYSPGVSFAKARSLPPAGVRPLIDSQQVLEHPASCAAAQAIAREDVRFVVLYRKTGQTPRPDLAGFEADPATVPPGVREPVRDHLCPPAWPLRAARKRLRAAGSWHRPRPGRVAYL